MAVPTRSPRAGIPCRVRRIAGSGLLVVGVAAGIAVVPVSADAATVRAASASTSAATATATPPAKPSGSGSGSGAPSKPPGGGGSSTAVVGTGALTQKGGTGSKSDTTITAGNTDESGVLVSDSGSLTLSNVKVSTTGASSSSDDSSFYGLNAGVLALAGSTITETGGSVSTTGAGGNGVFSYGSKSSIAISKTTITATGQYAHGIMASGGGSITAKDLIVTTSGDSSAPIATDRGGGTITATGGTYRSSGNASPAVYSTGKISVSKAKLTATGAEAVVVEGSNSVRLVKDTTSGGARNGVMIYQSFSGDASGSTGRFTASGGSLSTTAGSLFFVTNASAVITLSKVSTSVSSGTLLTAAAAQWGTSGSNGGNATLHATKQKLKGDVVVDKISTAALSLTKSSSLTGAIDAANTAKSVTLTLDASSTWTVTADSHVTTLAGLTISGTTVKNIVGNGHTVYYDASANSALGGKTYTLAGGGTLTPEK